MTMNDHKKRIIKEFEKLRYKHDMYTLFYDFVQMSACSFIRSTGRHRELEELYMDTVSKYKKEEVNTFCTILGMVIVAFEECGINDLLGEVFMELDISNKKGRGQCFTPFSVATLCGEMHASNVEQAIKEKGYATINDPCVGAGSMILGMAQALKSRGINYQRSMIVDCTDIDVRCVYMAYIQFTLLGIPAIIRHGDALSLETENVYKTPMLCKLENDLLNIKSA